MPQHQDTQQPSQWAVIELFGHQRIAGRVSEQAIAGATFVRVDVPAVQASRVTWRNGENVTETYTIAEHTRSFGPSAIYSVNWVDEAAAHIAAARLQHQPISAFGLADVLNTLPDDQLRRLPLPAAADTEMPADGKVPY